MRFANKVAIITGGASGIGAATVRNFVRHGASVMIADLDEEKGRELATELQQQNASVAFFKIDVTCEEQNKQLIAATVDTFGALDIVFANAGVALDKPADRLSFTDWQRTLDINLSGVFLLNKYAIRYWLKHNRPGVIVNCGSIHSWVGKSGVTAYAASKGGLKLLTQTLAIDYGARGIRVNAVCPGYIDTPLLDVVGAAGKSALKRLHPMGRLGKAEEVAQAVSFLASDEASFVNGASLLVDGGYVAQ